MPRGDHTAAPGVYGEPPHVTRVLDMPTDLLQFVREHGPRSVMWRPGEAPRDGTCWAWRNGTRITQAEVASWARVRGMVAP